MSTEVADAPATKGPSPNGYHSGVAEMYRCLKEYQYAFVRKVREPNATTPEPLAIGLRTHAGVAHWFGLGFATSQEAWASIKQAIADEAVGQPLPLSMTSERFALSILEQYVDFWSTQPRPRVLATEILIGPVPIVSGSKHLRTNRLDNLSYWSGDATAPMPGELKTTSGSIDDLIKRYRVHGQLLHQLAVLRARGGVTGKDGKLMPAPMTVMLDVVKKGYGGKRHQFARHPISLTERAVTGFAKSLDRKLDEATALTWNSKGDHLRSWLCVRKEGNMTVECPFLKLCLYGRSAAGHYVLPDGMRLTDWTPTGEQKVAPWD